MILRHLRYLGAVAEHGSIATAAHALRVAQPSLSRQLRSLERAVGVVLLKRLPGGATITAAGTALLEGANDVAVQLDEALSRARLADDGKLGTIRLGVGRGALQSPRVGRAIAALRARLPCVELDIREVASFAHDEMLLSGNGDLTIGVQDGAQVKGIRREPLFAEVVDCALLASAHPLARERLIVASQLRDELLFMIDPAVSRGFPDLYETMQRLHGGSLELHETVDTIYNLVAAGRGWTTALGASRDNPPTGTAVVPLAGLSIPLTMYASWPTTDRSKLIANVVSVLRRECVASTVVGGEVKPEPARRATRVRAPLGIESRHLRALTTTLAEGSVSRAATRLGLTQSGLSRQLHALAAEIGVELFRRGPNGIVATPAGAVLCDDAAAVLDLLDNAVANARGARSGRSGPCRIGAVPNEIAGGLLVSVIRRMNERSPEIPLEITEMPTPVQPLALRDREIDLAIASGYFGLDDDPAIASVRIGEDRVECALVSTSHPLASRAWLKPADLEPYPFLFIGRATFPQFYDTVMSAFGQIGLRPRIEGTFRGARTAWRLAADATGWTLGSRALRTTPPGGLVAIPIEGLSIALGLHVLWRRDERDSRVRAVLDGLRGSE